MAYFPLFVDLTGKTVLIAGGGPVAARKAKVLLSYGPRVILCAPSFPALDAIPEQAELLRRPFAPELLEGVSLAVAATDDRQINRTIALLCRARSIPVDVADSRDESTFLFPAVVRRGQLSLGISTEGASPAVSAWVRSEVEKLLPYSLEPILDWLGRVRGNVKAVLPQERHREAFTHLLSAALESGRPLNWDETEQILYRQQERPQKSPAKHEESSSCPIYVPQKEENTMEQKLGCVYLVGAGCGPADWITVRGLRLLRSCDAVVYDDLIAEELLDETPPAAQKIYMGKRLGRHSAPQEEISQTLIALARTDKTVVRLKGGDPFVFGRGGEEVQALQAAAIPFEVVPGISSSIAIPGQAGIPVTHRGLSRSFHVITAHTAEGATHQLDSLAKLEGTLVILMGLSQLSEIVQRLIAAGRAAETPAAVVSGGCAPHPITVRAPLGRLPSEAEKAGVLPPAVIVVGETAGLDLSATLCRPLEGARVALTGTPAVQARLRSALLPLGARPFSLMTSHVEELPVSFDWEQLTREPSWAVFTSQNGVESFFRRLHGAGVDLRHLSRCSFGVIGPATGAALRRHGIVPDLCPELHTTQGLLDALGKAVSPGQAVRLFRSQLGSQALFAGLAAAFSTQDVPLYRLAPSPTDPADLQQQLEQADFLVFSSASGVDFLLDTGVPLPARVSCLCIGPVTARALSTRTDHPFLIAREISAESLVQTAAEHWDGNARAVANRTELDGQKGEPYERSRSPKHLPGAGL